MITAGGGLGGSYGANLFLGASLSNERTLGDLHGRFGYASTTFGDGDDSAGGSVAAGQNSCGRVISQLEFGWAPTVEGESVYTISGGGTYTRIFPGQ